MQNDQIPTAPLPETKGRPEPKVAQPRRYRNPPMLGATAEWNEEARERIEEHYLTLFEAGVAMARCRQLGDPDLLASDVALRVLIDFGKKPGGLHAFHRRYLHNRIIDQERREATRNRRLGDLAAEWRFEGPDKELNRYKELWQLLPRWLEQLRTEYRRVIEMEFFDELSGTEIAAQFGVEPLLIRTWRWRALECLRREVRRSAALGNAEPTRRPQRQKHQGDPRPSCPGKRIPHTPLFPPKRTKKCNAPTS